MMQLNKAFAKNVLADMMANRNESMSTSYLHLGIEWSACHNNLWRIITTSNNLKYIIELKLSIPATNGKGK